MSALRLSGFGALLALMTGLAWPAQAQTVVRYVHTDALGSVVALTNDSRTVVERREYEPYGAQLTPAVQDGPGYTGHVQDAATGLTYMQQRYYDPGIGRFLSVDPVTADGNTGGNFNRYKYANNNPYRFTDPDGRQERPFDECTGTRIAACGGNSASVESLGSSPRSGGRTAGVSRQSESQLPHAVDGTDDAVRHYYTGDGNPVEIGDETKDALRNHEDQVHHSNRIKSGKTSPSGNYSVNLTGKVFHVGRTTVQYKTMCVGDTCATTYTGFTRNLPDGSVGSDGFWDIFGGNDASGPQGELFGMPYEYLPYSWSEIYSNPNGK